MTLERRTPLRRGKPLTASKGLARSRKPMARRSAKNRAEAVGHDEIREQVFARDGRRCRLVGVPGAGRCFGPLTPHHRRKASQGGGYTLDNLATLCAHHNDRLETDADLALLARTMGLVLKRGDEWGETEERFWTKVNRDGPVPAWKPSLGPCWIWTAGCTSQGYGTFHATGQVYAHRFALRCVEALIDGLEVDHLCRVRCCVNPRHLEQVTPAVNRARENEARAVESETCRRLHPWNATNTAWQTRPDGRRLRECRTCMAARQARYYQRKKALQ